MSHRDPPDRADGRRRRLDDLFGDEPHLSPTMRARRLVTDEGSARIESRLSPAILALVPDTVDEDPMSLGLRPRSSLAPERAEIAYDEPETGDPELTPTPRLLRTADALVERNGSREPNPTRLSAEPDSPPTQNREARTTLRIDYEPGYETIRLSEAAALLRSEPSSRISTRHSDIAERLRSEVLLRWLKELPPRRPDRSPEER